MEDDRSAVMDEDRRKPDPDDPAEQGSEGMANRDQPASREIPNRKLRTEEHEADRGNSQR
jgi:hypothetical protein